MAILLATASVAQLAELRTRFARSRVRFLAGWPNVAFFATGPGWVLKRYPESISLSLSLSLSLCVSLSLSVCLSVCLSVSLSLSLSLYIYMHIYICTCRYRYTYAYMYIHVYINQERTLFSTFWNPALLSRCTSIQDSKTL